MAASLSQCLRSRAKSVRMVSFRPVNQVTEKRTERIRVALKKRKNESWKGGISSSPPAMRAATKCPAQSSTVMMQSKAPFDQIHRPT